MINTRLTDLFGIKVPVIAGGLQWLATPDYVAAAAEAGIIGFMTAASIPELETLRSEIRRCRDLCNGKPFGVNVSMLPKLVEGENTQAVFDIIAEEKVPFVETSGRNPEAFIADLHVAGAKVIHKVPSVRFALKAQSIGVDAVSVVGAECGGHPGMDMIGSMVQASMAARELTIPVSIGGGIGNGEQLVAALAMGADGVTIGTRFLVAEEIWAHPDYKQRLVEAKETETTLIMQSLRNTLRAFTNETTAEVQKIEAKTPGDIDALLPLISGKVGREVYETGDWTKGALSVGQSVAFANKIEPLVDIVTQIEQEAESALARLGQFTAR